MAERVVVVGVAEGRPAAPPRGEVVVGHVELLAACRPPLEAAVPVRDLAEALRLVDSTAGEACILASGDPGFFGMVRLLAERYGPERLEVHPAPSSVSLAFARLGLPWDDAVVISAHGRDLEEAVDAAAGREKVAFLTSPDNPPERVAAALLARDFLFDEAAVCSHLGEPAEAVTRADLPCVAAGRWPARSVLVCLRGAGVPDRPVVAADLRPEEFAHHAGVVTKPEVRAVVLAKLRIRPGGVMWDVGAGSGSVGIEAAKAMPNLTVYSVERDAARVAHLHTNADRHDVKLHVVEGVAPQALRDLPAPDCVFLGGGGIEVLRSVCSRVKRGGRVVAAFAILEHALEAHRLLGSMVRIAVERARPLASGRRLVPENPVYVVWGEPGGRP
ncbi:MAG: precorrin-6y C5,15-methyltransferase subunit CbiE [Acidimicrobiales bacterium]|nr:MAG: precorrin-6y C5,15-methyltransferase subunit CbiE [Acidimicrobiales bacterium]